MPVVRKYKGAASSITIEAAPVPFYQAMIVLPSLRWRSIIAACKGLDKKRLCRLDNRKVLPGPFRLLWHLSSALPSFVWLSCGALV